MFLLYHRGHEVVRDAFRKELSKRAYPSPLTYQSFAVTIYEHYLRSLYGGIAQLARASGSYPAGRRFESHCRYQIRPVGQSAKTSPFHGGETSSTLVRVTRATRVVHLRAVHEDSSFCFYHSLLCVSQQTG